MAKLDRAPGEQTVPQLLKGAGARAKRPMIPALYFCDGADGGTRTRTLENEKQIFIPPRLSPPPGVFVVWTIPSPWPKGCRRRPSSLYTFLSRGLARDWRWLLPLAFPDFERFYSQRFRWGTPI